MQFAFHQHEHVDVGGRYFATAYRKGAMIMRMNPDDVLTLERAGWEALSSGPEHAQAFYGTTLAREPQMLLPGGMWLVGRRSILQTMRGVPWQSFEIEEPKVVQLSATSCMITYRVAAVRERTEPYRALICSTYVVEDGDWKMVLHQQTPA
jgi:hypothetical protein